MADFLNMGGYGQYVWPAYAASAVAIAGLTFAIWRHGKALREKLKSLDGGKSESGPDHDPE